MEEDLVHPHDLANFHWLLARWTTGLISSVEAMCGSDASMEFSGPPETRSSPDESLPEEPGSGSGWLWWKQPVSLSSECTVWLGAASTAWRQLAAEALLALGIDTPDENDLRDTFREIAAQSMAVLAAGLTVRWEREVTCVGGQLETASPAVGTRRFVSLAGSARPPLELCFVAGPAILRGFREAGDVDAQAADLQSDDGSAHGAPVFESMLDMEVPVSISFGSAKLRLDEVLALRDGSLVDLGRAICEPVDFQVNGRVVARGEVITVRGQYAIRIVQLSSPGEREDAALR